MAGRYLLGAAGAALLAVASTGSAHAADAMPIVVPVLTPVVVPPPGPVFEINIEKWLEVEFFNTDLDPESYTELDLKVTLPSGWGFQFVTSAFAELFDPPLEVAGDFTARVFRSMGNLEVGVYAGFGYFIPGGLGGYGFGFDVAYDTERVTIESYVQANFAMGAFNFLDHETDVTLHLTEMLDIYAGYDVETNPFFIGAYLGAQYDFGLLAPYATVWHYGGFGFDIGVEIEHQIGNGPFSLLGYAELEFDGGGPEGYAGIGIKFSRGGTD